MLGVACSQPSPRLTGMPPVRCLGLPAANPLLVLISGQVYSILNDGLPLSLIWQHREVLLSCLQLIAKIFMWKYRNNSLGSYFPVHSLYNLSHYCSDNHKVASRSLRAATFSHNYLASTHTTHLTIFH